MTSTAIPVPLDGSITAFEARIVQAIREDDLIRRLLEVEGISPTIASALVAAWAATHSLIVAGTCPHGLVCRTKHRSFIENMRSE